MPVVLRLPVHPNRNCKRPLLIDDLLQIANAHHPAVLSSIIEMLADLHRKGCDSRYLKPLKGPGPVWELKTRSRGGQKGGCRVYLFFIGPDCREAVLVRAEVKKGDAVSQQCLEDVADVLFAYESGQRLW